MAHPEGSEGQQPQEHPKQRIDLSITPDTERGIIFKREADNTLVIGGRGEFEIRMNLTPLPTLKEEEQAQQALFPPERGGTAPLPAASEAVRKDSRALRSEQPGATNEQAPTEALKSPVPAEKPPASGCVVSEGVSHAVTEPHSAGDRPSWEKPAADIGDVPENENEKFVLEGNPAKILGYRVTRKTNTRIADFVLATHPTKDTTSYWRVRAFGDEAEKVRDQVEVGQKGVEVTVYGPKYWKGRRKTQKGYEETVVKGYHAGFVNVPREYRQETPQSSDTTKQP